jgi:hypothetical protein
MCNVQLSERLRTIFGLNLALGITVVRSTTGSGIDHNEREVFPCWSFSNGGDRSGFTSEARSDFVFRFGDLVQTAAGI